MSHTTSYSEIDTFRQCGFKHQLAYVERWQPPEVSAPLARGSAWHEILEHHYRTLQAYQRGAMLKSELRGALHAGIDPIIERMQAIQHRDDWVGTEGDLLEWMYVGYVNEYGLDPDWEIVAVEHNGVATLPTDRGTPSRIKLKFKIDVVVRQDGQLWLVDHKTGKDLPKEKELDINDQFGLYTWAMRHVGYPVFGSLHNAARTYKLKSREMEPHERWLRHRMFRTDDELDTIAVEAYKTMRNAYGHKTYGGDAPRSPDDDRCKWRCDFTEACLFGRKGSSTREFLEDTGYFQNFERH